MKRTTIICDLCKKPILPREPYYQAMEHPPEDRSHYHTPMYCGIAPAVMDKTEIHTHTKCIFDAIKEDNEQ